MPLAVWPQADSLPVSATVSATTAVAVPLQVALSVALPLALAAPIQVATVAAHWLAQAVVMIHRDRLVGGAGTVAVACQ